VAPDQNSSERLRRDPLAERVLLDRSQRLARLSAASWPQQVEERLEVGQGLYGDSWADRPLSELLAEISEEALDIGAWGCLAAQALSACELGAQANLVVGEMLAQAMGAAATAHAHLIAARAFVRRTGP
jgi:hypothetical protein